MRELLQRFKANGTATLAQVSEAETALAIKLPQQYVSFLTEADGGEGFVGAQYVVFWRAEELVEMNDDYEVRELAPGLCLFGTNGADEGFAFDTQRAMEVVVVPLIGLSREDAIRVADTFDDFLRCILDGRLFGDA